MYKLEISFPAAFFFLRLVSYALGEGKFNKSAPQGRVPQKQEKENGHKATFKCRLDCRATMNQEYECE